MTRGLGLAVAIAAIAALAVAAVAFAGTATIHDGKDGGTPKCADIDTVNAKAGDQTAEFHVLMFGNVKARPCDGISGYPAAGIHYANKDCAVHGLGPRTGTGEPGLYCGNRKEGWAKIAIDPNDNKKWDLTFHTKDLPGKPTKFRFFIITAGIYPGDSTADSGGSDGLVPIKIG
jgi:hypothetical protein